MSAVDERIKELGFELIKRDDNICSFVYENEEDDHHVEINFDGVRYFIYSATISTEPDWYGQPERISMAMSYEECKAFLDKIDELKEIWEM